MAADDRTQPIICQFRHSQQFAAKRFQETVVVHASRVHGMGISAQARRPRHKDGRSLMAWIVVVASRPHIFECPENIRARRPHSDSDDSGPVPGVKTGYGEELYAFRVPSQTTH